MANNKTQQMLIAFVVIVGGIWVIANFGAPEVAPGAAITGEQPTNGGQEQPQGVLTSNPSLVATILSKSTNTVQNEAIVRLLDATGQQVATGTTSSGEVTISNLTPNATYKVEVLPVSGNTAFYAFTNQVTVGGAGPTRKVWSYYSETTTAPTLTVYNNDGLTANASTAQAIGVNEQTTFRIRVRPASSTDDGNRFSDGMLAPLFVVDYNNLAITQLSMKEGTTAMAASAPPSGHTLNDVNKTTSAAFVGLTASLIPATDYDYYLTVKSSTAQNPVSVGTDDEMYVTVYDGCRIRNTQTGAYVEAYVDPVNNANICSSNGTVEIEYS